MIIGIGRGPEALSLELRKLAAEEATGPVRTHLQVGGAPEQPRGDHGIAASALLTTSMRREHMGATATVSQGLSVDVAHGARFQRHLDELISCWKHSQYVL